MKRLLAGAVVLCLLRAAHPGHCDFNPFVSRRVMIGDIASRSGEGYGGIAEFIRTSIFNAFRSVPFLTLTDQERSFLQRLAELPQYKEQFLEAGSTIRYKLTPSVEQGPKTLTSWPLYISGEFEILPQETVRLSLREFNSMLDSVETEYSVTLPVQTALTDPQSFLVPFLREILRYQTFTVNIEAQPSDSYIFLDETAVGVGTVRDLLFPAGRHRLSIVRDGYEIYTDFFTLSEDGTTISAALKKLTGVGELYLSTDPTAVEVFVNEKYAGMTPLRIQVPSESSVITLRKAGYSETAIPASKLLKRAKSGSVELTIPTTEQGARLVESARKYKKQAITWSYLGIGMIGVSILLGVQQTLYEQKAELYRGKDPDVYQRSRNTADTLSTLTYASSAATAGIFIFSFSKMLKYFYLNSNE